MSKTEYDFIVSIGADCACTRYLRKNNLQKESYPFDWLTNAASSEGSLGGRFDLILNEFKDFMNLEDLKSLPKDSEMFNNKNFDYYENTKNGLYYFHEFPRGVEPQEIWPEVRDKYKRRIKRFYQMIQENDKVLFVWFSHRANMPDGKIIEYSDQINNKLGKNIDIIIFENNKDYPINDKYETVKLTNSITKYILNTYPDCISDKTRGNVELCNQVFKLYSLNESFIDVFARKSGRVTREIKRVLFKFMRLVNPRFKSPDPQSLFKL